MAQRGRLSLLLLVSLAVAACSTGGGGARERLDAETGLTWASATEPAVFARTDPRFSRAARDYLYFGPVETNTRGFREYYLWVGIATTIDRGFLAPDRSIPSRVVLEIDGEPVVLDLVPWDQVVRQGQAIRPYDPPVSLAAEFGVRVTRDLLSRINAEAPASVSASAAAGTSERYFAWRPMPSWPEFTASNRGP